MTPFQSEQFGRPRHVPAGLFELPEDVFPLSCFSDLVQTAKPIPSPIGLTALASTQWQMTRLDPMLRIEDYQTLHQISEFSHISRPTVLHQHFHGLDTHLFGSASVG